MYKITDNTFDISKAPTIITSDLTEEKAKKLVKKNTKKLKKRQRILYAQDKFSILCIFQATDASGKDGAIKHVLSGINPAGAFSKSFKQPTEEELSHDWLWRCNKSLPERGHIGIFNRSYYEEVTAVKVFNYIQYQHIPKGLVTENVWNERYADIRWYEDYLKRNGTVILKFFLNLSKDEQKNRFVSRIETESKNWKASKGDILQRKRWDDFQMTFQDMINETSTDQNPWHVIPADNKWLARKAISDIIIKKINSLKLAYPTISREELAECRNLLENE